MNLTYSASPEISRIKKRPIVCYPDGYWFLEFEKQNAVSGILTIYVSGCKGPLGGSFKITYSNVVKTVTVDFAFTKIHSIVIRTGYTVTCEAVFSFESPLVVEGWFMRPYELMDDSSRWNSELVVLQREFGTRLLP
uniref:ORF8 n=1 Tax=Panagrellus redivivus TaxID=6233 RepID=A0A7E4UNH4_PANRE